MDTDNDTRIEPEAQASTVQGHAEEIKQDNSSNDTGHATQSGRAYREPYRAPRTPLTYHTYDGHAIAALTLGIIAVLMPMQAFGLGSLVGIALAIIGLFQAQASLRESVSPMARTGKILSIIALVLSVLSLIALIVFTTHLGSMFDHGYQTYRMMPRMTQVHRFWF